MFVEIEIVCVEDVEGKDESELKLLPVFLLDQDIGDFFFRFHV